MVKEDLKEVSLQQELKKSTEKPHQSLEKRMVKVIKNIKTPADYVKFLELLYGFYAAVEKEVDRYMPFIQVGHRRTADRLLKDITQFGPSKKIEICRQLPNIDSLASALGAMYVLEGSVMGAPQIASMISSQLKFKDANPLSFFTSHGEDINASWTVFQSNFNRDFEDDEKRAILRTAYDTFCSFSLWIDVNYH